MSDQPKHVHKKIIRTPEEAARLRELRERLQSEKPTPEDLIARSGVHVLQGQVLLLFRVGHWLREERTRQGLSLAELATKTGIDEASLSRLETGRNLNPTVDTLYRVGMALGKEMTLGFGEAGAEVAEAVE